MRDVGMPGGFVDITDLLRRLLRLRLAVAVILVLALAAAAIGYRSAGQSRQSGAALVIVPPAIPDTAGGDNPLLNLDNNMAQLAVVLAAAMQSASATAALEQQGATGSFTVSTVTGDNPSFAQLSPQIVFRVTADSDALASRTVKALVTVAGTQLAALQDRAGVDSSARASLVVVVPPTAPEVVAGGHLRAAGALGVGVLILGLVLVLIGDALRRRRRGEPAAVTTEGVATAAAPTAAAPTAAAPTAAAPTAAAPTAAAPTAAAPTAAAPTAAAAPAGALAPGALATPVFSAATAPTNGTHPSGAAPNSTAVPVASEHPPAVPATAASVWRERQDRAAKLARRLRSASGRHASKPRR